MANKKTFTILPLSDVHYGSENFNEALFEEWLKYAKNAGTKSAILLMGDLIEVLDSNRFYKGVDYVNVNDQISYVVDALKPFKNRIICNLTGNHGNRCIKQFDLDLDKLIGDMLDVETSKSFHGDLNVFKGKSIRIFAQHEAPASKSTLLAMRRFINQMENISDCDLYLGGHNHKSGFNTKIYRTLDDDGEDYHAKRRSYCFTGSFLDYKGSYADNGRFDFQIPSFSIIKVNEDLNMYNKCIWADLL